MSKQNKPKFPLRMALTDAKRLVKVLSQLDLEDFSVTERVELIDDEVNLIRCLGENIEKHTRVRDI